MFRRTCPTPLGVLRALEWRPLLPAAPSVLVANGRIPVAEQPSSRFIEIVAAGRHLLEAEGSEALTMRRVAQVLGIQAPSLYKHLPEKAALEAAIIADGFREAAAAFEAATDGAPDPMRALVRAYRTFVSEHPHMYRLMTERPLPRDRLPAGLEARTAAPLLRLTGSPAHARAAWGFIHGMVMLELNDRFPSDGMTEQAWESGVAAFVSANPHPAATRSARRSSS